MKSRKATLNIFFILPALHCEKHHESTEPSQWAAFAFDFSSLAIALDRKAHTQVLFPQVKATLHAIIRATQNPKLL
jgi:hypothetical protein